MTKYTKHYFNNNNIYIHVFYQSLYIITVIITIIYHCKKIKKKIKIMMMNHEKNHIFLVIILLILNVAFATPSPNNMKWPELSSDYNPIADPKAVVISNNARFTVLTPYLIRMEYSSSKQFEDRATTAVLNRETTVPEFTQSISKDGKTLTIEITSSKVTLSYQIGQEFSYLVRFYNF